MVYYNPIDLIKSLCRRFYNHEILSEISSETSTKERIKQRDELSELVRKTRILCNFTNTKRTAVLYQGENE